MPRPKRAEGEPRRKNKTRTTGERAKRTRMLIEQRGKNNDQKEREANGGFFKYAYRLYFCNDIPPRMAFDVFCGCVRTDNKVKCAEYLLKYGEADRDGIREVISHDTFEHYESLDDKYAYLRALLKEVIL